MPLVKHYIPNDEELKLRLKHQKVVKKRETSEDLTNGAHWQEAHWKC